MLRPQSTVAQLNENELISPLLTSNKITLEITSSQERSCGDIECSYGTHR